MGVNFLPFARREVLTVPGTAAGLTNRASTSLTDFSTAGCIRAHLDDVIIFEGTDEEEGGQYTDDGGTIRFRMGVFGGPYLTEDLYDYRCYQDGVVPLCSVWYWKRPYRIYPGERITVYQGPPVRGARDVYSAVFSGVKISEDEPIMLYAVREFEEGAAPATPIVMDDRQLVCPGDSPVDLYSVASHQWDYRQTGSRILQIIDAQDRPFWQGENWANIIDPPVAPCRLQPSWVLRPDQTLNLEFENLEETDKPMTVILRGCLEVEDPRREE